MYFFSGAAWWRKVMPASRAMSRYSSTVASGWRAGASRVAEASRISAAGLLIIAWVSLSGALGALHRTRAHRLYTRIQVRQLAPVRLEAAFRVRRIAKPGIDEAQLIICLGRERIGGDRFDQRVARLLVASLLQTRHADDE